MDNPSFSQRLALRCVEWPLVRVFIFDPWFRGLALVVLAGLSVCGLALPRLWTVSPPGFVPVVKISGLAWAQAWSLQRGARRLAAAGRADEAALAWQLAVAHNPASPTLVRGALEQVIQMSPPPLALMSKALGEAPWLLRLTATNQADLILVARLYDACQMPALVLGLLAGAPSPLPPAAQALQLKALFWQGRLEEFARAWRQTAPDLRAHPELALFQAAYQAGWGPPDTLSLGKQLLANAALHPPHQVLANRLQLLVDAQLLEVNGYGATLGRLTALGADQLADHLGYWRLLAAIGRKAEAQTLARAYRGNPTTASQLVRQAEALRRLDLNDAARDLLQRYATELGNESSPAAFALWDLYANLLIQTEHWEELRSLSVQVRTLDKVRITLAAFSHLMEGRALYGLGQTGFARTAFEEAAQQPFPNAPAARQAATLLLQLQQPDLALRLLGPWEAQHTKDLGYWLQVFQTAYEAKATTTMARAADRAYELAPANNVCENNYAAALLITRQRPAEVLELTARLLARHPDSLAARVNHASALALNHHPTAAAALLERIAADRLGALEATMCYLNWFQIHFELRQFDRAWTDLDRIQTQYLFSPQRQWLEATRRRLPPRAKPLS